MHDVAVIGAGADGLAASIFAAEVAVKAILVSGGGRCNVTHDVVTPIDFFVNRRIIKNVLAAFSVEYTVKWLASLGGNLKREETGMLFPVTDQVFFCLPQDSYPCFWGPTLDA